MRKSLLTATVALFGLSLGALSIGTQTNPAAARRRTAPCARVDCLRINQLQNVGSHNSYHIRGDDDVFNLLRAFSPALADSLEYTHPALATQFGAQKVRQIELDVFADPSGGLYKDRHIYNALGKPTDSGIADLSRPGLKVMHVQDVDFKTRCYTFVACLRQIKRWSDLHPTHLPISILVEAKDDTIIDPANLGFVTPAPFDAAALDQVDIDIRSVFAPSRVITPDDVRKGAPTLEQSVLSGAGWPTVEASRGKVMFMLDNESRRDLYLQGHPSLSGRMLFTPSFPGQADAAFIKDNDPIGADGLEWQRIQGYVRSGYVVRTRADTDTIQARTGDTTMRDAALRSGAQWVSTDYPTPADNIFGTGYFVELPGGGVSRCNPISARSACRIFDLR